MGNVNPVQRAHFKATRRRITCPSWPGLLPPGPPWPVTHCSLSRGLWRRRPYNQPYHYHWWIWALLSIHLWVAYPCGEFARKMTKIWGAVCAQRILTFIKLSSHPWPWPLGLSQESQGTLHNCHKGQPEETNSMIGSEHVFQATPEFKALWRNEKWQDRFGCRKLVTPYRVLFT